MNRIGINIETHNKIVADKDKKIDELENENRRLGVITSFLVERNADLVQIDSEQSLSLKKQIFELREKNSKLETTVTLLSNRASDLLKLNEIFFKNVIENIGQKL